MDNTSLEHHQRLEYCNTRLKYRSSKKLTAVRVYTIANESRHLLVFGIPKINLLREIKKKFAQFGVISSIQMITEELQNKSQIPLEQFTDCCHLVFQTLHSARKAKKFLDATNFYGGVLHISYAPERESLDELRSKLNQRVEDVKYRTRVNERKRPFKTGNEEFVRSKIQRK